MSGTAVKSIARVLEYWKRYFVREVYAPVASKYAKQRP